MQTVIATVAVAGVLLLINPLAWACTVVPQITGVSPSMGSRGEPVTVRGEGFNFLREQRGVARSTPVPVEIRWNGGTGSLVAVGDIDAEGRYLLAGSVPEAVPGTHYLMAVVGGHVVARTPFLVTASSTPEMATPLVPLPSLQPAPFRTQPAQISRSDEALGISAGVLALGLVATSSFAVTLVLRRRRVTATKR